MDTEILNAVLLERHDIGDALSVVCVRPDVGEVPEFKPGQFITLALPREVSPTPAAARRGATGPISTHAAAPRLIRRAYSIASSPNVREYMEFYVVLVPQGLLTPRLWTVPEGGRLWMDNKAHGEFTLDHVPPGKDVVLVATGTGIAPYMSMLRTYKGQSRWRRCVVIEGARVAAHLAYRSELEAISREDPSVVYIPTLSREPLDSPWPGLRGRVQAVLEEATYRQLAGSPLDPEACHIYLCGNPAMITSVSRMLQERGFRPHTRQSPGNIHVERFW